ncbi:E3 ubiquitin-protein ligase XIAP [Erpetoichthys calabaricus]|uniref:E3 ubiquitin-protein ligase XIAP n=1 Tax=Erpetoichthys calabaricus TaxID=27687 RepID=A0A8C4X9U2_ERPCA|nr:E3 ubiquitin-protein ligase XIAP [Erpetoichthys calabaricus]XP_051790354.1 E3 ubiquitin-protein ligase XIAP [Erpetoichthys calabaricus]
MAFSQPHSDIEMDLSLEMSNVKDRMDSFHNSSLPHPDILARAGFYFVGGDQVKCFSCNITLDGWECINDPLEKHLQASPECIFLRCTWRLYPQRTACTNVQRPIASSVFSPPNRDVNCENTEEMDYLIRTGGVVDNTPYPRNPAMNSEEARLLTFHGWPESAPVRPENLAQAGLYYTTTGDRVMCFCCGGSLQGWESGDDAWSEHERHYPNCFFILGHEVGNVPSVQSSIRITPPFMSCYEDRLRSFSRVQHNVEPKKLAEAGFYSNGEQDKVWCFECNGGLKDWNPNEDPWTEHAKYYPGCSYLIKVKGQAYVNNVQFEKACRTTAMENGCDEQTEEGASTLERLRKLQDEKLCKVCLAKDSIIVFIPCGHLVTCHECSARVRNCPICRSPIESKIKTYIS